MADLIRRADAIKAIGKEDLDEMRTMSLYERITSIPSVEPIRCKDCRWSCTVTDDDDTFMCGAWSQPTQHDGYCHLAKRKEQTE